MVEYRQVIYEAAMRGDFNTIESLDTENETFNQELFGPVKQQLEKEIQRSIKDNSVCEEVS